MGLVEVDACPRALGPHAQRYALGAAEARVFSGLKSRKRGRPLAKGLPSAGARRYQRYALGARYLRGHRGEVLENTGTGGYASGVDSNGPAIGVWVGRAVIASGVCDLVCHKTVPFQD